MINNRSNDSIYNFACQKKNKMKVSIISGIQNQHIYFLNCRIFLREIATERVEEIGDFREFF